uniref:Nucleotide-diphospho-sugar transferase domain-containing protein n=1 Tax=Odontella aurita TaxID=265563 RepID=A0A6U6KUT6_9STRA
MIAFVHPSAAACSASDLRALGYDVRVKETPVNATEIRGEFLRRTIQVRGCCQEKELLKLYAYTLTDYPVAVHLDVDSILLRPLDDLFDAMIGGGDAAEAARRLAVHGGAALPENGPVNFFFTRDYNLVNKPGKPAGIQGGFMAVRPSVEVYEEYRGIVLQGDHYPGSGWGRKGHGGYYGAQQIQGLCAYYYDHVHPGTAVELDRCRYNQMVDDPRFGRGVKAEPSAGMAGGAFPCRDGRDECEDCRTTPLGKIRSAHFTICQKPWTCRYFGEKSAGDTHGRLCDELHGEWHRIRSDLEEMWRQDGRDTIRVGEVQDGDYRLDHFRGHCSRAGGRGYIPLKIPTTVGLP